MSLRKISIGHVLVACVFIGFSVLILGGYGIWKGRAPIPATVAAENGEVLFGAAQIHGGQAVYQKYGLMDWGSVLGHGTYYGPDFTAETLHRRVLALEESEAQSRFGKTYAELPPVERGGVDELVRTCVKANRYDAAHDRLVLSTGEVAAFRSLEDALRTRFTQGEADRGLPPGTIKEADLASPRQWVAEGDQIHQIAAFFWWTSWLASAERPGTRAS
jgi:nitric oxide reductase subunit B